MAIKTSDAAGQICEWVEAAAHIHDGKVGAEQRREMLRAQRGEVSVLLRDGVISDEVYGEMISQIDAGLMELERMAESGADSTEQEATA